MRKLSKVALIAAVVPAAAIAQDVNVTSTTFAQMWKQDTPGFDKATYTPATEFLGIDASKLGTDALSLHLYGWGRTDLRDQSVAGGKTSGNLTYGYLEYDFDRANAQVKAGRLIVDGTSGNEMVDGVFARTDLRGGFAVSAFGGKPVVFKNLAEIPTQEMGYQRNFLAGARLSWRIPKMGEIGLSYLQDGSNAAKDLVIPEPYDFTRRQMGADLTLHPAAWVDFSGRTVWNVAAQPDPTQTGAHHPAIAEHDYKATFKALDNLSFAGGYLERNLQSYFAGSTLPNLFNQNELGTFTSRSASATWSPLAPLQLVADVRTTSRDLKGNTTRAGLEGRWNLADQHLLLGGGYHKVNAYRVQIVDSRTPAYSLSHSEMRAWALWAKDAWSASLDAIRLHFADAAFNPNLYGKAIESDIVGSLGYQATQALKVSGDLSVEDTPLYKKQVMGLLRVEYRFGFALKGGK
jgi:hypothetical protein